MIETIRTSTINNHFGSNVRSMFESNGKDEINYLEFRIDDYLIRK
jgi:hypothetical protein